MVPCPKLWISLVGMTLSTTCATRVGSGELEGDPAGEAFDGADDARTRLESFSVVSSKASLNKNSFISLAKQRGEGEGRETQ